MSNAVERTLEILASSLRPYVAERVAHSPVAEVRGTNVDGADAQFLLVFMWDHWHDLFRHELTFLDRSTISELREFRNRWAHQARLSDRDVFRIIDNVDRLLKAIGASTPAELQLLYNQSLERLHQGIQPEKSIVDRRRLAWQLGVTTFCGVLVETAVLGVVNAPLSWIIALVVLVTFIRLGWLFVTRSRAPVSIGPRECPDCGRIIYSVECPYCRTEQEVAVTLPLARANAG
ncbi:MAG: hypothetical protein KDA96_14785 [Planctomycetaceae bacterium]|nr:hypothetical protein [Planctomycetaceae bacterium]